MAQLCLDMFWLTIRLSDELTNCRLLQIILFSSFFLSIQNTNLKFIWHRLNAPDVTNQETEHINYVDQKKGVLKFHLLIKHSLDN